MNSEKVLKKRETPQKTILGHPRGLLILFLTEMWERFSYYGMRALLVLYLTQHFLFSDEKSGLIFGAYTAMVYIMTLIGGTLADRYLGSRKAVTFGAILLVIGHFGMAFEGKGSKEILTYQGKEYQIALEGRGSDASRFILSGKQKSGFTLDNKTQEFVFSNPEKIGLPARINRSGATIHVEREPFYVNILYLSLALIITGVGYLKANISTIVGALYGENDPRRDSGFTIFYMGINLGAFLASLACGYLGIVFGWKYGFGLAGIGMLFGLAVFLRGTHWLEGKAEPPAPQVLKERFLLFINKEYACYSVAFIMIAASMFLVMRPDLVGNLVLWVGAAMLSVLLFYAFIMYKGKQRWQLIAATYFCLAQIPLWILFEQAGTSISLLTDRLVDRTILGWTIPAPMFQSLNAFYIFAFAPVIALLWVKMAKRNIEPSTPVKFSIGVFLTGVGFLVLVFGMKTTNPTGLIPVIFIFLLYWFHTMGELMLSPVGLSSVTKLAPAQIVGMVMGAWFLYTGIASNLAAKVASKAGVETIGGKIIDVVAAKETYMSVYTNLAWWGIAIGVIMLVISPLIKKLMSGTR